MSASRVLSYLVAILVFGAYWLICDVGGSR